MKITFIGTGSAFTLRNWNTSLVINHEDKNLLIDAGMDVRHALHDVDMSAKDIDAVYVTHQHADHAGGLEWLAFMTYFSPDKRKPKMLIDGDLAGALWRGTLSGGLHCVDGRDMMLYDYFDVHKDWEAPFEWNGVPLSIHKFDHIRGATSAMQNNALVMTVPGINKKVFITGDMKFVEDNPLYGSSDLIIHDCETGPFQSGVHAHYDQLRMLPPEVKAKMLLVHYQDNIFHDRPLLTQNGHLYSISHRWSKKAEVDGFPMVGCQYGFAPKGHTIDLDEWFKS